MFEYSNIRLHLFFAHNIHCNNPKFFRYFALRRYKCAFEYLNRSTVKHGDYLFNHLFISSLLLVLLLLILLETNCVVGIALNLDQTSFLILKTVFLFLAFLDLIGEKPGWTQNSAQLEQFSFLIKIEIDNLKRIALAIFLSFSIFSQNKLKYYRKECAMRKELLQKRFTIWYLKVAWQVAAKIQMDRLQFNSTTAQSFIKGNIPYGVPSPGYLGRAFPVLDIGQQTS